MNFCWLRKSSGLYAPIFCLNTFCQFYLSNFFRRCDVKGARKCARTTHILAHTHCIQFMAHPLTHIHIAECECSQSRGLPPNTANKIHFFGADFREQLLACVDADVLPRMYGGNAPGHPAAAAIWAPGQPGPLVASKYAMPQLRLQEKFWLHAHAFGAFVQIVVS